MTQHTSGYMEVVIDGKTESGIETGHYEESNHNFVSTVACTKCNRSITHCTCEKQGCSASEYLDHRWRQNYIIERVKMSAKFRIVFGVLGLASLAGLVLSLLDNKAIFSAAFTAAVLFCYYQIEIIHKDLKHDLKVFGEKE